MQRTSTCWLSGGRERLLWMVPCHSCWSQPPKQETWTFFVGHFNLQQQYSGIWKTILVTSHRAVIHGASFRSPHSFACLSSFILTCCGSCFCRELERDELSSTSITVPEMLLRYVWFKGVWGTLAGVMVSVTVARGMGKYKYFSKGAGSYHHGSCNLEAPMDGAQCVGTLRQWSRQSTQGGQGTRTWCTSYAVCSFLAHISFNCHQHMCKELKTPLQMQSPAHS